MHTPELVLQFVHERARDFGLELNDGACEVCALYLATCLARMLTILTFLCSRKDQAAIEACDIEDMKALSAHLLQPTVGAFGDPAPPAPATKQSGGSTTLPSEFYGIDSGAYSTANGQAASSIATSTQTLVRPAMDATFMCGGAPPATGSETPSSDIRALLAMDGAVFELVLAEAYRTGQFLPLNRGPAKEMLANEVEYNLLNLLADVKAAWRRGGKNRVDMKTVLGVMHGSRLVLTI